MPPATQTVIVAGASSLVGRCLLPRLRDAGFSVIALSRQRSGLVDGIEWRRVDINQQGAIPLPADAIYIHLAPIWLLPAVLSNAACSRLARVVAFSSTSVLSKRDSANPSERELAARLAAAEQSLMSTSVDWTILRPTLIYGYGQDKNVALIARLIRRCSVFPLIGAGTGKRQPVHADDLAQAVIQLLASPASKRRIYALSGGETLSYREMVVRIFQALGKQPRIVTLPPWVFAAALGCVRMLPRLRHLHMEMAYRMNEDLCFSNQQASQDFGYAPRPFNAPLR